MQDSKITKNSPSGHHHRTFSGYIFATNACIDNRHNMVNFGSLAAEICWRVWGTPANFNGFLVLAALLRSIRVLALAKVCGVEHRAPPTFGRAAIMLGIGPHSSFICVNGPAYVSGCPSVCLQNCRIAAQCINIPSSFWYEGYHRGSYFEFNGDTDPPTDRETSHRSGFFVECVHRETHSSAKCMDCCRYN